MAKDPKAPSASGEEQFLEQMNRELAAGWVDPVARLRQALEHDELQLYCQPILLLRPPGGFPMAEVLVRLREEEALMLPPGDFLPVFEHYKMMVEFDRWVVRSVLRWLAKASRGLRRFSINVSAQALEDGKFPRFVAAELASTRVPPQALTFEIDESDTLARLDAAARFAAAVKKSGCRVLIDGFARRSVSFIALKKLRADFVKVDGAIVRALLRSEVARQKMKAVLRVGEAIGVEVIAECVEEKVVLDKLRELGAGFAQGFGIARPAPIDRPTTPAT